MPDYLLIFPFPTQDLIEGNSRQVEEESSDSATTVTGYLPTSAQCFQVRSLQHWIDLCA